MGSLQQGGKPLRIFKETTALLKARILTEEPPWYRVVKAIPPSTILIRTPPVLFADVGEEGAERARLEKRKPRALRKSRRFFQPEKIVYLEDKLRLRFYNDHPWEFARPRILVENDGRDHVRYDWSRMLQPGKMLDGESVIQRQMWLIQHEDLSPNTAYDTARKEFYRLRMREDVQRRIAVEEAKSVGATFGKTYIEIGMEMEDQVLTAWKAKAQEMVDRRKRRLEAMAGTGVYEEEVDVEASESRNDGVPGAAGAPIAAAARTSS